MSSSTRSRREPRAARSAAAAVVVLAVLWLAAPGAVAAPAVPTTVPLSDVTVLPVTDAQVSLVVDVDGAALPTGSDAVSVSVAGVRQPATVVPVISDQLAVGIVVDASQQGGGGLQSWLSGAARFVLEEPAAARTAVVADTTPPVVLSELRQGPVDLVRALSGVQAHGSRRTSDAVTLAVRQLPPATAGPRVVVLYTGAGDAGGEPSTELATRLAGAHVLLVVVTNAADTRYWSSATRPTGGFLAPAVTSTVSPAFDQVATTLRNRYLVSFPAPGQLPAHASVQVSLRDVTMAADVEVPSAKAVDTSGERPRPAAGTPWPTLALWAVIVSLLVLAIGVVLRFR